MSTKLSFRARALDPSKAMPIYFAEELPDLQEYSAINRAVPQMPSGMEKEEESEHHLQRAIIAGLIIPTPEVSDVKDDGFYDKNYPADYKMPRQLIHVQPLSLEQDIPDYDMDSADEMWFDSQNSKTELTPFKFEQMMDRLEKITVCSLDDAKALVRRNEVNQDVFDYWVNKRLKTKHPLILSVKTENRGNSTSNNPYIAFRRRTEKMQTRKNRKNDETSYEKMLKLRRDLSRAVKLLEMVKRREKTKREELQLSIEIYEKRYQAKDFSGQLMAEYTSAATKLRPAFAPLYSNQYHHQHSSNISSSQHNQWNSSSQNFPNLHLNHLQNNKRDFDGLSTSSSRKEKRQYKKRKHKAPREIKPIETYDGLFSSEEEEILNNQLVASESEDEGIYPFRRNRNCDYFKPHYDGFGNWPWESSEENGRGDSKYRFNLTSLRLPRPRCIGFARRRVGRGGRILLDRASSKYDDVWSRLDYTIFDSTKDCKVSENRFPEIFENNLASSNDDFEKTLSCQNYLSIQNNHQNNNIVIKSENSKNHEISDDQTDKTSSLSCGVITHQKLDDFEQLLDNASASSNIINKKLVCRNNSDISDETFVLKASGSIGTELVQKSSTVALSEASSSGVSSTNGSTPLNLLNQGSLSEVTDSIKPVEDDDDDDFLKSESTTCSSHSPEDFYMNFIDEIKNEWLHFRPKTPPLSPSSEYIFDSDLIDNNKKFAVELQMLNDDKYKETEMSYIDDNVYLSQPISFNFNNKVVQWHEDSENVVNVKTELIENENSVEELKQDAILKLLEKYQKDVSRDESLFIDMDDINYSECVSKNDDYIGCSDFKLVNDEIVLKKQDEKSLLDTMTIKMEADFSVQNSTVPMVKEAPIAELQSHNYVLQYGSPSTVSLNPSVPSKNMISCNPNMSVAMEPGAATLFQQQFINSGNTIISTTPQQQNKLQPIVYDNNTIVLAATQPRKQLNGPSERNLNQSKYKQVFMLDLTQDKRKKTELGLTPQNILVSSVTPNLLSTASSLSQQTQNQQFSLVHQNALQKPIILSTSSSAAAGTLLQTSQSSNVGSKIITPQISGNVFVSTHGKIIIPSSNSQSIILDSKMISTNNQIQTQQKLQSTHQQRSKMENNLNIMRENSEKNIIYTKKFPSQSIVGQQSIGIISNKTIQRIQQPQQQQILRPQYGTSSATKIIQQPNNGNNILGLGSVNNNNDNQVNSTTPR